jgi:hypothetical protein
MKNYNEQEAEKLFVKLMADGQWYRASFRRTAAVATYGWRVILHPVTLVLSMLQSEKDRDTLFACYYSEGGEILMKYLDQSSPGKPYHNLLFNFKKVFQRLMDDCGMEGEQVSRFLEQMAKKHLGIDVPGTHCFEDWLVAPGIVERREPFTDHKLLTIKS